MRAFVPGPNVVNSGLGVRFREDASIAGLVSHGSRRPRDVTIREALGSKWMIAYNNGNGGAHTGFT